MKTILVTVGVILLVAWTSAQANTEGRRKPGTCPSLVPGQVGTCDVGCVTDYSCPGRQKCCSNGCGTACQNPQVDKPGKCPVVRPGQVGICIQGCTGDHTCPGKQKCCSNGCGVVCQEPRS